MKIFAIILFSKGAGGAGGSPGVENCETLASALDVSQFPFYERSRYDLICITLYITIGACAFIHTVFFLSKRKGKLCLQFFSHNQFVIKSSSRHIYFRRRFL